MPNRGPPEGQWSPLASWLPFTQLAPAELANLSREHRWGFAPEEIARLRAYFRKEHRDPTDVELAGLAQSWSEHCSYKSSRPLLRAAFGPLQKDRRVLGTGDAGVMRLTPKLAYALRIESHNHPSAIEPYGGAATGIGGILRDVLAVGADPIALADPLFFGPLDSGSPPAGAKHPGYLLDGVVAGIRDYGNRVGVPTVTGMIGFAPEYTVNPLVNVACLGLLPIPRLRPNRARAAGDALVLVGGATGRDGIGGVAFASAELTPGSEQESRGAVQLGNAILKEPLIRACLEAFDEGLVAGVKDLGGGGLAAASGELVHAGGFGSDLHLDRVPLRERGLLPWEVWISESQERMLLDVAPPQVDRLLAVFRKHDVPATVVGEVVRGHSETLRWNGDLVGHLELGFRVDPPPARRRLAAAKPKRRSPGTVPETDVGALFEQLVLALDSRSREPILRLYDHEVRGRSVLTALHGRVESPAHGDAAVLAVEPEGTLGLAVAVAAQPALCALDAGTGAALTVEELARNLYAVGARPDAYTNCLNFGNPEEPRVLGAFAATVKALAGGARAFGFAVPSGNVSFYNGGLGSEIPPTPVLFGVGIVPDIGRSVSSDLKAAGNPLYLLGPSRPELGGSLYARLHPEESWAVPLPDAKGTRRRGERLLALGRNRLLRSVHDVSDGGLAVTLAEMAFGGGLGFDVDLAPLRLPSVPHALAAEGGSRWVVEVDAAHRAKFERATRGEPRVRLGSVTAQGGRLRDGERPVAEIDLAALYPRWRAGPLGTAPVPG